MSEEEELTDEEMTIGYDLYQRLRGVLLEWLDGIPDEYQIKEAMMSVAIGLFLADFGRVLIECYEINMENLGISNEEEEQHE